jgi:hypothetical protein
MALLYCCCWPLLQLHLMPRELGGCCISSPVADGAVGPRPVHLPLRCCPALWAAAPDNALTILMFVNCCPLQIALFELLDPRLFIYHCAAAH